MLPAISNSLCLDCLNMHADTNTHTLTHTHVHSYVYSFDKSMRALKSNLTGAQQKECFPRIIPGWDCRGSACVFVCACVPEPWRVGVCVCVFVLVQSCVCVSVCVGSSRAGRVLFRISLARNRRCLAWPATSGSGTTVCL